jgi:hypothetical protein
MSAYNKLQFPDYKADKSQREAHSTSAATPHRFLL